MTIYPLKHLKGQYNNIPEPHELRGVNIYIDMSCCMKVTHLSYTFLASVGYSYIKRCPKTMMYSTSNKSWKTFKLVVVLALLFNF